MHSVTITKMSPPSSRRHQVKLPEDIVVLVRQGFRHRYPMVEKVLDSDGKPLESTRGFRSTTEVPQTRGTPLGEYVKESSLFRY